MPTYVYACTECDHRFEAQQAFSDDALTECPNCSGKLRKVFNSVGIVFKGSGFYRNDSRGKEASQNAAPASAEAGDKGAADKSTGDKGATKTETAASGASGSANGSSGSSNGSGSSSGGSSSNGSSSSKSSSPKPAGSPA